jgi:hypothetical protein
VSTSLDDIKVDLDEIDRALALKKALADESRGMPDDFDLDPPSARRRPAGRGKFPDFIVRFGGAIRAMPELCEIEGCGGLAAVLDHCHETGRFRGWLCQGCNQRLGRLGDNVASVRAEAAKILPFLTYMEAFEAQPAWELPPQLRARMESLTEEPPSE